MKEEIEKTLAIDASLPFYLRCAKFSDSTQKPKRYIQSKSYGTDKYFSKFHYKPILLRNGSL